MYEYVDTANWFNAYGLLLAMTSIEPSGKNISSSLQTIKKLLIRDTHDLLLAWILVCFVPWARKCPNKKSAKKLSSPASIAAREGIKADNKICKNIDDAVANRKEIVALKNAAVEGEDLASSSPKRKKSPIGRDIQGQAIRSWGSNWRSAVIYALLTDVFEANSSQDIELLTSQYALWLRNLESLDLLNVDKLRPLVNGNQIFSALGAGSVGPWMKKAMDIAMEWQLRNPNSSDPAGGIEEVLLRKKELGFS